MKRMVPALAVLLAGVSCAGAADRERAAQAFRQLDANGDLKIEFAEIQAARARWFDRWDANRDGFLEADEFRTAARQAKAGGGPEARLVAQLGSRKAELDKNGDGRISRQEFTTSVPVRLIGADADGDGALSLPELRSLRRR
jgi:Ca2+-binding EF-hand superfamily protein